MSKHANEVYTNPSPNLFEEHLRKGGQLSNVFIKFLLKLRKISYLRFVPVLNTLSDMAWGLWVGHKTEAKYLGLVSHERKDTNSANRIIFKTFTHSDIFDYLVVGSGPGAVTAILNLPKSSKILVIEKGDFPQTPQSEHHTLKHVLLDFEKAGQEIIFTWPLGQFAQGSVLGGGSEVNSGLYHSLPRERMQEYLVALKATREEWKASENKIRHFLKVSKKTIEEQRSMIWRGASKLNLDVRNVPRWRRYRRDGSFKQNGMINLFWNSFEIRYKESNVILKSRVESIRPSNHFISVKVRSKTGIKSTFRAKNIILCGGAIESPYLLAKARLIKWRDTRFQWHPMLRAVVRTSKLNDLGFLDIDPFQAWDHSHEFKFGSAVSTPGLISLNIGQEVSNTEFNAMRSYYVSFRSSGRGGIVPWTRSPWYFFSKKDLENLKRAKILLKDLISAGGGIFANNLNPVKKNLSTVHIFGTMPINSDVFIPGTNRIKKDPRVSVADASILPTAPGVNPQGVVMTTVDILMNRALWQ